MKKKVPKIPVGLPELLKKQSRFSGGGLQQKGGPVVKFTPTTFRITQHKGGGGK